VDIAGPTVVESNNKKILAISVKIGDAGEVID
jgi:hypothetical protein